MHIFFNLRKRLLIQKNELTLCIIFSAPLDVKFSSVESTSFEVDITPRDGHPAVERYEATAVHGSYSRLCTARAGRSPLYCWMSGLSPSTEYTVSVVACLPGRAGCGPAFVRKVRTCKFNRLASKTVFCVLDWLL